MNLAFCDCGMFPLHGNMLLSNNIRWCIELRLILKKIKTCGIGIDVGDVRYIIAVMTGELYEHGFRGVPSPNNKSSIMFLELRNKLRKEVARLAGGDDVHASIISKVTTLCKLYNLRPKQHIIMDIGCP